MTVVLYIALFGALGCLARYFLSGWVYDLVGHTLPYGTLAVNVIGAFLIGLVMEFGLRGTAVSPEMRIGLTIGFLGGFTTFSTFSYKERFHGATVLRGVAGFGAHSVYHTDRILRLSRDLPMIVEVVDSQENVDRVMPRLDEMIAGGMITLERVMVMRYAHPHTE